LHLVHSFNGDQHRAEAGKWVLSACVLGLAPIWVSIAFLVFLSQAAEVPSLVNKGQLALYAASLAGTSLYLVSIDRNPPGMRWRSRLHLGSLLIWTIATLIYVSVGFSEVVAVELDRFVIIIVSVATYLAALVTAFYATLVDNERLEKRYEAIQTSQAKSLADGVRELGE
jgi:hypothetical protein